jgi:hypothetical protein
MTKSSPATKSGSIKDAIQAYLVRSVVSNVPQATADKISRLRQFFGSALVNSLDPRPPEKLKHARKREVLPLKGISPASAFGMPSNFQFVRQTMKTAGDKMAGRCHSFNGRFVLHTF